MNLTLDNKRHVLFTSLVIVLSLIAAFFVTQFEEPMYQTNGTSFGADFFPYLVIGLQIIICIALLVQSQMKEAKNNTEDTLLPIFTKLSIYGIGFLIGYTVMMHFIGYLYASLLAFAFYLLFFKVKAIRYYLIALVFVFIIYYLFGEVFVIALPEGLLFY